MTIYAKKNPRGQPTGKWQVEVTTGGRRLKATAETLIEARQKEAAFKNGEVCQPTQPTTRSVGPLYTIGQLRQDARTVWAGTKDEIRSLQRFNACCDLLGDYTDIKTVRTIQLDRLVEELRGRGLTGKTVHRYLSAISAALRWAHKRDLIAGMPHIPWPEQGKGREDTISQDDERRLIDWLYTNGHIEVATIYETLLATGMRIGELLSINPKNIDTTRELVVLLDTKNGDDRTVPLERTLGESLARLIHAGLPSYWQINRAAQRARKALGINHSITPHVMRHTVVTRLEAADVGLKTIGQLVGHRSIATTAKYAHPNQDTLRKAMRRIRS